MSRSPRAPHSVSKDGSAALGQHKSIPNSNSMKPCAPVKGQAGRLPSPQETTNSFRRSGSFNLNSPRDHTPIVPFSQQHTSFPFYTFRCATIDDVDDRIMRHAPVAPRYPHVYFRLFRPLGPHSPSATSSLPSSMHHTSGRFPR